MCIRDSATTDPDNAHIEKIYADLFHYLCGNRIDFDYGDEEMLSRLYSIERTPDGAVSVSYTHLQRYGAYAAARLIHAGAHY